MQVVARLANFGPAPVSSSVQLSVTTIDENGLAQDSSLRSVADVSLAPERWSDPLWLKDPAHAAEKDDKFVAKNSVEFSLDLTSAAIVTVRQTNTDGDLLPADDVARVAVPPPKDLSILLVTEGNYYLERLLESLPKHNSKVMPPSAYEQQAPTDFDVIFFDNYPPKKLPPNGNFVCINSVPEGLKIKPVLENGAPVVMDDATVLDWKREHPMFKAVSLRKLYAEHQLKLDVPAEDEVLVEGMLGPMMVLHREAGGMFLVIPFSDIVHSSWPTSRSFPAFWVNAVQFMAAGSDMDLNQSYDTG